MDFVTNVTQKGQVTIPKDIRDLVGIELRSKVRVEAGDGYVKVMAAEEAADKPVESVSQVEEMAVAEVMEEEEEEKAGWGSEVEKEKEVKVSRDDEDDDKTDKKVKTWFGITYRKS